MRLHRISSAMRVHIFLTASLIAIGSAFGQSYSTPAPVFSNLFGGSGGTDAATAVAVDGAGNVVAFGTTNSPDFPVTNAAQPRIPQPSLTAVTASGVTYPSIGAVDVLALAASADGSVVYAASDSGMYRSADGGATWAEQKPGIAGAAAIAVDGGSVNTVYAAVGNFGGETTGGFYKSTDGGYTWSVVPTQPHLALGRAGTLSAPSQLPGTIYSDASSLFRSRDGGVTWIGIGPHNYNVFSFALAPSDPNVVYTVASDGFLYRSADGGNTWTTPGGAFVAYPNANGLLYTYALAVDPKNENILWALTAAGTLSKSTDGGATFATVLQDTTDQTTLYLSISASDNSIVESSRGAGMASFDGGATWHSVLIGAGYLNAVLATPHAILGGTDAVQQNFLTKWSADGSKMIFSTFLAAGYGYTSGGIASDNAGNTWVASTSLTKFDSSGNQVFSQSLAPLVANAIALDSSGNAYLSVRSVDVGGADCTVPAAQNALVPAVMKFDPQGNLLYSQNVMQICQGFVYGIAVDASGSIYLAGTTMSASLPTTSTAIQPTAPAAPTNPQYQFFGYGFVAILSPQATQVTYLSYIGGGQAAAYGVTVDTGGNVYVTGSSLDVSVPLSPTANFGGASGCPDGTDTSFAFVVKLTPSSSLPLWFTELGGGCSQAQGSQVTVDASGNVWVGGPTVSGSFPTLSPLELQGYHTAFVSELSADGRRLLFSSYAPGYFALGPAETLYLAGAGYPNPPKLNGAGFTGVLPTSALIEKVSTTGTRAAVIEAFSSVSLIPVGGGDTRYLGIAPGQIIQLTGLDLGPDATAGAQIDSTGRVATSLSGTRILFDGFPAPLISVQASSVVCMVPFEVGGQRTTSVQIERNGVAAPGVAIGITAVALLPGVLAVANADGTENSQSNPAHYGQAVTLYVTGFGDTSPSVPDGFVYRSPLPVPLYPIIDYGPTIAYVGPAPGMVAGIWQVNIVTPTPPNGLSGPLSIALASSYLIDAIEPSLSVSVWVEP